MLPAALASKRPQDRVERQRRKLERAEPDDEPLMTLAEAQRWLKFLRPKPGAAKRYGPTP